MVRNGGMEFSIDDEANRIMQAGKTSGIINPSICSMSVGGCQTGLVNIDSDSAVNWVDTKEADIIELPPPILLLPTLMLSAKFTC